MMTGLVAEFEDWRAQSSKGPEPFLAEARQALRRVKAGEEVLEVRYQPGPGGHLLPLVHTLTEAELADRIDWLEQVVVARDGRHP